MKKILVLLVALLLFTVTIASPMIVSSASAFTMPQECGWVRYNQAFWVPCIVKICFELGLDLEDYL